MPRIELIDVPRYDPTDPYHFEFDNLPIDALEEQIVLVNNAVDINSGILQDSIGSAGTLSNRLNKSLEESGALKTSAVDDATHSIEEHTDSVDFVRMTDVERAKLSAIAAGATDIEIDVETISTTITFDTGTMTVAPSDSITWRYDAGKIKADTTFPLASRHRHHYDVVPVHATPSSPNFTDYVTTSTDTVYIDESIRIHINGRRVTRSPNEVFIPGNLPAEDQVLMSFTETDSTAGTFSLSTAITSDDVIVIDFDQVFD